MNIEEIGKQLAEMRESIDSLREDQNKIDERVNELDTHIAESHDLEDAEVAGVKERWNQARSKYTAEIQGLKAQKAQIETTIKAQLSSLTLADSLFQMLTTSVQKTDIAEVLDDLETSTHPDFKSARVKLQLEEDEADNEEAEAQETAIE